MRRGNGIRKKTGRFTAVVVAAAMCVMAVGCAGGSAAGAGSASGQETLQAVSADTTVSTAAAAASSEEGPDGQASTSTGAQAAGADGTAEAAPAGETSFREAEEADTDRTGAAAAEGEEDPESAGTEEAAAAQTGASDTTREEAASAGETQEPAEDHITFDGETDLEYNARQILEADETITREGALGIAAYLWQMGFGRMSGYPSISEVDGGKVLTVFDTEGLFYNIFLTPEGKIQEVEDVEGNELITLGTKAGELVKPPISGADVIALLEEWKSHGGHSQVVSAYNQYAGDWGRSRMSSDDLWCSETVSAAYAALGVADKIGGMASNGNTYEKNARSIGAWVSGGGYVPSTGDIVITHDSSGDRHTACVVSCDGGTIHTIAGGGSSIHHSSISVGSGRITGFVVPEW